MNCLFCGHRLTHEPVQICPGCQTEHEPVPPVSGVNHVSQLLFALQMTEAGELDPETLAAVTAAFMEKFDRFHQAWNLSDRSLVEQAGLSVREQFGPGLRELDLAIESIIGALEAVEQASDDPDAITAAQEQLAVFYHQVCGASALLLKTLEKVKQEPARGLLDLPTV